LRARGCEHCRREARRRRGGWQQPYLRVSSSIRGVGRRFGLVDGPARPTKLSRRSQRVAWQDVVLPISGCLPPWRSSRSCLMCMSEGGSLAHTLPVSATHTPTVQVYRAGRLFSRRWKSVGLIGSTDLLDFILDRVIYSGDAAERTISFRMPSRTVYVPTVVGASRWQRTYWRRPNMSCVHYGLCL
jgi:hypothetical protein